MLCIFALALMAAIIPLRRPMLLFFGASADTLPYADEYFLYYICLLYTSLPARYGRPLP